MIIYQWDKILLLCYILIFNGVLSAVILRNKLFQKGNDSNLLIVFYVQIMPDDFVMQLHRF